MDQRLCSLDELEQAVPKRVRVDGRILAVVRIDNEVYAVDGICAHWQGMLTEGKVSAARREIICPWHKFRYSLVDGRCVASNKRPAIETFEVRIDGNDVYLSNGGGTRAAAHANPVTQTAEQ